MSFLLLESEVIAKEVAWQLRTRSIGKLVVVLQKDSEAIGLAVSLAGGKNVKRWRLFDLLALIGILSLVFVKIAVRINKPEDVSIETEGQLTHTYVCRNEHLYKLRLSADCENNFPIFTQE